MKIFCFFITMIWSSQCFAEECFKNLIRDAAINMKPQNTIVKLSKKISIPAVISVNRKGNGSMVVANLELMVYDDHNNGLVFDRGGASILLVDLNGDETKELVISSGLIHTDDDGAKRHSYFVRGYRYDTASDKFKEILAIGNFQPDVNAGDF
ncbi:MAG: hypothetical protein Q9M92_01940 [Enterobacterales bacterium]|nr:hypothetical protein [Enterobacterales bacterium]